MPEQRSLSAYDAESEATLLRSNVESDDLKSAFLNQIAEMSKNSVELLEQASAADPSSYPDHLREQVEQMKEVARVALLVKLNPSVLADMITDPSHPRLLDLYDKSISILKTIKPETYRILFDRANLVAELKMQIGEQLYEEVTTAISKATAELQDASVSYPAILNGTATGLLAVTVVRSREPFAKDARLSPVIWGKFYAFIANEIDLKKI